MTEPIFNGMLPVYLYEEGIQLPNKGTYFIIAGNGNWLHKDTGLVRGLVPVDNISVLDDFKAKTTIDCSLPKIPIRHVWRIKEFFRNVVDKFRSEAEINLYYSKDKDDFKIHVPEQIVSHSGVQYRRVALTHQEGMSDYLRVGTIHSHCDFGAFHSGTDIDDENDFDGLHVTFGNNDQNDFTVSASIVMNSLRVKIDPLNFLEGLQHIEGETYRFIDLDKATTAEWASGLNEWMTMVKGTHSSFLSHHHSGVHKFSIGDSVTFNDDLKSMMLRGMMGDGPFEVLALSDGKITINAKNGLVEVADILFSKDT